MNKQAPKTTKVLMYILGTLIGFIILAIVYFVLTQYKQITSLNLEKKELIEQLASTTQTLQVELAIKDNLVTKLSQTEAVLAETNQNLNIERNRNQDFEDQIRKLAGTVNVLDKVAKTDSELLQKYSKVYFLNENYIPDNIRQIDKKYVLAGKGDQYFQGNALAFLTKMINAAARDDIDLKVVSAYRSFETQSDLKGSYKQTFGSGANTFSADQGYSEHQLGTTVDLTDPTTAGTYLTFKDTKAYAWLQKNAYKYGFELSYPEGNSFYVFEPWHWRFVGVDLATDLHRANASFYDWEQRKIDGYLVSLFD